ncbi:MAG: hypothetical protein AB1673_12835 [Actinomycetota bacterium]
MVDQTVQGPVVVPTGSQCYLIGTTVIGGIVVQPGGSLELESSVVRGSIAAQRASVALYEDVEVTRNIESRWPTYFEITGSTVGGSVTVRDREPGAGSIFIDEFRGHNTIGSHLVANSNAGDAPFDIYANFIGGHLVCLSNPTPPAHADNVVAGHTTGQCAGG